MKKIEIKNFGKTKGGESCRLYILENDNGDRVGFTEYGAALVLWELRNEQGGSRNIVLGYDDVSAYEKNSGNLGAVCGRFANRIRYAEFRLNEKFYRIPKNEGEHVCHSGAEGFSDRVWSVDSYDDESVRFVYHAADGETGFPGNMTVSVTYSFDEDRQLMLRYEAESDQDTVINLTNHSYFNLAGEGDISDQYVEVNASFMTPVDGQMIPTGEVLKVEGTDFDLREKKLLKDVMNSQDEAIASVGGLDHNFVVDAEERGELRYACRLIEPESKMQLVCYTTEPAVQVYTANMLDELEGSGGRVFGKHKGICFETQNFPCSPNICHFPSPVLKAGEKFISETIYAYGPCTDLS